MLDMTRVRLTLWMVCLIFISIGGARAETIVINDAQLTWVDDVSVASRDAGVVVRVAVRPNDEVTRTSVLVQLDDGMRVAHAKAAEQRWSIALEQSDNEIDAKLARKQTEVAKSSLDRGRAAAIEYRGAISRAEMERLELEYDRALLAEEQAEHDSVVNKLNAALRSSEYELAQLQLKHRTIHAPLEGQVVDVAVQVGEWVSEGQPIARVVNVDNLRIVALMPERYVYSVSLGQSAQWKMQVDDVTIAANGRVSFISPEVDPVNGEFTIWVDVNNPNGKLRSGFVGTLKLESD